MKEGAEILIVDRERPVARLEPVLGPTPGDDGVRRSLVQRELISPAKKRLDMTALRAHALPEPGKAGDILSALLNEREGGR